MSEIPDLYPILGHPKLSFPSSLLAPHNAQAQKNHGQSLQQLKRRGGLSPAEMVAVLEDRSFETIDENAAIAQLQSIRAAALNAAAQPVSDDDEKRRRIYYQSIVYDVCNIIDRFFQVGTVCGTVDEPTTEVQDRLRDRVAPLITEQRSKRGDVGYWVWQGDDSDHLESLTCPVLISADHLRELLAKIPDLPAAAQHEERDELLRDMAEAILHVARPETSGTEKCPWCFHALPSDHDDHELHYGDCMVKPLLARFEALNKEEGDGAEQPLQEL